MDIKDSDKMDKLLNITKERPKTLIDLANEINSINDAPKEYDAKAIKKAFKADGLEIILSFVELLKSLNPKGKDEFHKAMEQFVQSTDIGFGKLGQPLRVALFGAMRGPGLDEVMDIIGIEEVESRVESVKEFLKG